MNDPTKPEAEPQLRVDSPEDRKFRRDRLWHSFLAVLWSGLGGATFFSVLNNMVGMAISAGAGGGAAAGLNMGSGLMMGGMMALGVAFTYLAQQEWTECKFIEDERLARVNAEMLCKQQQKTVVVAAPAAVEPEPTAQAKPVSRDKDTPSPEVIVAGFSQSAAVAVGRG